MKLKISKVIPEQALGNASFWCEVQKIHGLGISGEFLVAATLELDDQFIEQDTQEAWLYGIVHQWTQLAGSARNTVYVATVDGEAKVKVVAGCPKYPWVVVRGPDNDARLCADMQVSTEGNLLFWYTTEAEAIAAATCVTESLIKTAMAYDTCLTTDRLAELLAFHQVRVVEAGPEWDWATVQQHVMGLRCRIVDGLAVPN